MSREITGGTLKDTRRKFSLLFLYVSRVQLAWIHHQWQTEVKDAFKLLSFSAWRIASSWCFLLSAIYMSRRGHHATCTFYLYVAYPYLLCHSEDVNSTINFPGICFHFVRIPFFYSFFFIHPIRNMSCLARNYSNKLKLIAN